MAYSFNKPKGKFNIVWQGFTLDNWLDPFAAGPLTDAMVLIAEDRGRSSAVVATILGHARSPWRSVRYRFSGGALISLLLVLPITTPEIVMGSSLATLFIGWGGERGFTTIVIAHILF